MTAHGSIEPGASFSRDDILRTFGGEAGTVVEFVTLMISEVPRHVRQLSDGIRAKQLGAVARLAHATRGAVATVGAAAMVEIVGAIEDQARAGNFSAMPELCAEFEAAAATLVSDLETWARELSGVAVPEPDGRPMHVLVCDDDPATRFVARALLLRMPGCTVVECGDGRDALRLIEAGGVNLAILDIEMPVLGGVQLLETIRQSPRLRSLPVIMLSSERRADVVARLLELGVCSYEVKPLVADRFTAAIQAVQARPRFSTLPHV